MNYIGSKNKLTGFLKAGIEDTIKGDLAQMVFCDLFAGTGIVGRAFKSQVKQVISNDVEYYSYVLIRNYIGNHSSLAFTPFLEQLNTLQGIEGFIYHNYSEGGNANRLYFSEKNGKKIDAIRQQIGAWKACGEIGEDLYFFLLASLLEAADRVANTASVYGAFLKKIKPSAAKELILEPALFEETTDPHRVYQCDSNELIKKIEGDILYLDPPYNERQYGANYHLLNTLAKYDTFVPRGKTGLRDYYRSSYCRRGEVKDSFEALISNAKFRYLFFSYNNEGLLAPEEVKEIMGRYGKYSLLTKEYQRFKADKTANRNHKASTTVEYLHILEK